MAAPQNRVPVRVARGTKGNLDAALALGSLKEGELVYAKDLDELFIVESGVLIKCNDPANISIDELNDVNTTTTPPSSGDLLSWNGTNWVPDTLSVNDLNDVNTSTPTPVSGNVLGWNGTNWVAVTRVKSDTAQGGTNSVAVANIVSMTLANYNALSTPDPNTLYFVSS